MPTHTPSPHRFLAPNSSSAQKSHKPHSSLRNAPVIQTPASARTPAPKPELQFKKLAPAKRFVIAPPQRPVAPEHGRLGEREGTTQEDTRVQHLPRPKPRRKLERVESIEEPSQSSPLDAQDDSPRHGVIHSIKVEAALFDEPRPQLENKGEEEEQEEEEEDDEMLFETVAPNKRRRTSPPSSPSLQQQQLDPSTPLPAHISATSRFKVPPPRTPAPFPSIAAVAATTPASASASAPHRPHFILPALPTSPQKPSRPPPEIFSPSRKIGKYLSGGLASTVSSWVIETANTGYAAQDRGGIAWGRDKDDGVKTRIRVSRLSRGGAYELDEDGVVCFAGGIVFARGDTEPGIYNASRASSIIGEGEMRVLLAGQGGARGSGGIKVKIGSTVGIRAPTWEVDVRQEKWLVAVDWVPL
ncbi:hypothetical protein TW65_71824 [Stemphylium lycopersici]|nr:hypothetical protein TW65_71824 [Stemphylium lycopersici]